MCVHLFGVVSSPSCANVALRRIGEEFQNEFPSQVTSTAMENFYVDVCLKSLPSCDEVTKHVDDQCKFMFRAGFNLTKWISNDRELLESIPASDRQRMSRSST